MITNPEVGMSVQVRACGPRLYRGRRGTIVAIHGNQIDVVCEGSSSHATQWFYFHELSYLTPDEVATFKEKQRRQIHADKYL